MTKRWSGLISATDYIEPNESALLEAIVFVLEEKFPNVVESTMPHIVLGCTPEDVRRDSTEQIDGEVRWWAPDLKAGELKISAKEMFIPHRGWDEDGIEVTVGEQVFNLTGLTREKFKFVKVEPRVKHLYSMPTAKRKSRSGHDTVEPKYRIGRMCSAEYTLNDTVCKVMIEATNRQHEALKAKPDVQLLEEATT